MVEKLAVNKNTARLVKMWAMEFSEGSAIENLVLYR